MRPVTVQPAIKRRLACTVQPVGAGHGASTWARRYTSAGCPLLSATSLSAKNAADSVRCFARASCTRARSLRMQHSGVGREGRWELHRHRLPTALPGLALFPANKH